MKFKLAGEGSKWTLMYNYLSKYPVSYLQSHFLIEFHVALYRKANKHLKCISHWHDMVMLLDDSDDEAHPMIIRSRNVLELASNVSLLEWKKKVCKLKENAVISKQIWFGLWWTLCYPVLGTTEPPHFTKDQQIITFCHVFRLPTFFWREDCTELKWWD